MNCPKCGLINTGNLAVGLAMPQCMCQWQHTQEKCRIETVPAQGTLFPKREWVGLTQQDIDIAFDDTQEGGGFNEFAHAIEAKLKEKNSD